MLMPVSFGDPEREYRALTEAVAVWDVAAERQVQIRGKDAGKLVQMLTCRNVEGMEAGICLYAIMCDDDGTVINDPVLLKHSDELYWLSIADSDVLLWTRAHASANGFDVEVTEPDVSPLALQGPNSLPLCEEIFPDADVSSLKYFHFVDDDTTVIEGMDGKPIPCLLARSGWSPERGYEIYLKDGTRGEALWDVVMHLGAKHGVVPGCPNNQRRIEGGMLSFGGDTLADTNALELGLPKRFVHPDCNPHDFIGKAALERVVAEGGPARRFCGIVFDEGEGEEEEGNPDASAAKWRGKHVGIYLDNDNNKGSSSNSINSSTNEDDESVGTLTALAFSPRFGRELGLGVLDAGIKPGNRVYVRAETGVVMTGFVARIPFKKDVVETRGKEAKKTKKKNNNNGQEDEEEERTRQEFEKKGAGHSHLRY